MRFRNRQEAGDLLAQEILTKYRFPRDNTLVLGLARGGLPVAERISRFLQLPLDVVIVRKLGYPGYEEFAMGAIGPAGNYTLDGVARDVPENIIQNVVSREFTELQRRNATYRKGRPPLSSLTRGRNVILVDDGIATGSSIKMAIQSLREYGVSSITVACPVAPSDLMHTLSNLVDDVIIHHVDPHFMAVGGYYAHFPQVNDTTVISILENNM